MKVFCIEYTNRLSGETEYYMNIGFQTQKWADSELVRILDAHTKWIDKYPDSVVRDCIDLGINVPVSIIGTNFKVVPKEITLSNR